jgi:hypothetical protein
MPGADSFASLLELTSSGEDDLREWVLVSQLTEVHPAFASAM